MSYTSLFYHIVFSTKERRLWLKDERLTECCRYVGGIVRELKGTLLDANGAADHVHLVALLRPTMAISDVLQEVKGSSSKWVHERFAELRDFSWQDGYAAFSMSKSAVPDVLKYVRGQEEHHCRMSFEEELTALLDRHGVEYDPKYILR